jgi:hypothetical protein
MDRRNKVPATEPHQDIQPSETKSGRQIKPPREPEKLRKGAPSIPRRGDVAEPAEVRMPEPSEAFAERGDIETADESAEQHDRRHHDRSRGDVESREPV